MTNETKPKTIGEFLNELPEPYRSQAIENCENYCDGKFREQKVTNIVDALLNAFIWKGTPQAHTYWEEFFDSLPK
jgi:hypothetical protein